jgi:UDP-3-O-[3-hydroxymyristoyl] glucosamine N-acyltransferase
MVSLSEIADFTRARVTGHSDFMIEALSNIVSAAPGSLTFLGSTAYEKFLLTTKASAIFVREGFEKSRDDIVYLS